MKKSLKLTKISLETEKGKQVTLTIEEAKDLYDQLHELFGKDYYPSRPIIIDPYRWPYRPYQPYWTDDNSFYVNSNSSLTVFYSGEEVN